ncbi:MAG: ribonuclease HII [Oscillatoriales cyanobacterium SM2_2_1]|nr:ribonuclease HII [Oscillatoriales cyanobacterium SM2_2_1]
MAIAGVDEVGRGALFGCVVAAAVFIEPEHLTALTQLGVTDSKRLSPKRRESLVPQIQTLSLEVYVGVATVAEIEQWNILEASLRAMERAIAQCASLPEHCYIDGNQPLRFRELPPLPQTTIIAGDRLHPAIAAASIVAKVWRDRHISVLATQFPQYDLANNKGYGTAKHRAAIAQYGLTPHHRRTWNLCSPLLPHLGH